MHATIMGLGRHGGGVAATKYLAAQGAKITVTDLADEDALKESLAQLSGVPLARVRLEGHDENDFTDANLVVVNPAVRPGHPLLQLARAHGVVLTSESELFLNACPCGVIGVTGSTGKSTTATMIASMLRTSGRRTWLGGNIGVSLLGELERMTTDDWVVLELSSFQLAHLSGEAHWPGIAVITNCSPNHLDWHGTYEHYVQSKQRLVREQSRSGLVVFNSNDPELNSWQGMAQGRTVPCWPLERIPKLPARGRHLRENASCAAAAAEAAEAKPDAILAALSSFQPLPHRLEWVANVRGRRFYDDSKSTSIASTLAALEALDPPIWLLAGGQDKSVDLAPLTQCIVKQARGAAFFGAARRRLMSLTQECDPSFQAYETPRLGEAIDWCFARSQPGDGILLSPACASFDQYRDYAERGAEFVRCVGSLG